ncbi:serine peptidase [Streptomyces sp. NPDC090108]|uniref:serine peptidase n=1 Tax=Streptomyces sp. NPDC090108 TaxID=3365947 RepID=UPI0037FF236D
MNDDGTGTGPSRVLGVHGIGNLQPGLDGPAAAARLAGWWSGALAARLPGAPPAVEMAYYAHHLRSVEEMPQGADGLDALPGHGRRDALRWGELLGAGDYIAQGRLTAPLRALVSWVAGAYGLDHRLAGLFVAAFFTEVGTYFTQPERRTAAVGEVARALRRTRPRVVIAHSLGSVVTYDALWTHAHPDVELLLTVGSPLAMPDIVYDRLLPHPGPRRLPPGVRRWVNVSDPGDIVAVPPRGVSARFEQVTADLSDSIGVFDFHRATKYLGCAAVAGVLAAYL